MAKVTGKSEAEFLKSLQGKTLSVLFETEKNGIYEGYTKNYSRVEVKSKENISGKILNVKIISSDNEKCFGEIV